MIPAAGRTFDLISLGEPLYELAQEPDGRFAPGFGGDSSNMAIAAARLGARVACVTRLGDDLFGAAFLELWARERIDASAVETIANAPTGVYFITYRDGAHAFTYLRKGSAASTLKADHVPVTMIARAKVLHVSGVSLAVCAEAALFAIASAAKAGTAISLDTNYRSRLWSAGEARVGITQAARQATIVKTSIEDAQALHGLTQPFAIARLYRDLGAKAVVITEGAGGASAWSAEDDLFKVPAHPVAAIDASGAGDAFSGALIAFLCAGRDFRTAVKFANVAAALSTRARGATAGLPDRQTVIEESTRG